MKETKLSGANLPVHSPICQHCTTMNSDPFLSLSVSSVMQWGFLC